MTRIGILALLIVSLLGACSSPSVGATMSPSVGVSASPSVVVSSLPSATGFPAEVAGLPVVSVARADELLRSGRLDGQAVAVAGYFDQFTPSCPYPGRYIGPLESWCRLVAFTDSRVTAQLCQPEGSNGMRCSQPSGTNLSPWFMAETSGNPWSLQTGGATAEPVAVVLIGHAGDPRQWQCTAATQAECAGAFVVDRIAWANGHDIPPSAPQVGSVQGGKAVTPRMTLPQVAAAIGVGDDLLTGAALRRGDVATVDPRWNLAGDGVVWLVRSLAPAVGSGQTRPETVWLVDDATGKGIDSQPLQPAADYRPARLWQMATVHGLDCCTGDVLAFYRVRAADGTTVYEGRVRGDASGGQDGTTYGGGYMSTPLDLPAGEYSISAWLAPYGGGAGAPRDECSASVTLGPLDDVRLNADFPAGKACALVPAPSPSPGP